LNVLFHFQWYKKHFDHLKILAAHFNWVILYIRVVFTWAFKVIRICLGFVLLRSVCSLWLVKSLAPLSHPIRSKTKTNRDTLINFFPRFCRLHVFASSFDWFSGLSVSFVIGQSDYFGFVFYDTQLKTTLWVVIEKAKVEFFW